MRARPRGAARALPPRRARRRPRSTPPTPPTTRSWSARSSTTSTPSRCAPTSSSTRVRQGLLDVTGRLFGLRYEPVPDAPVWHEDVTAYDVHRVDDGGERDRPDLPRPAPARGQVQARRAVHARRRAWPAGSSPEGVLVCNFSRGLMEHDHVVTLFHEFGHLVHHVLAGHGDVDPLRRRRHRVGLRRGAEPDARGVGLGRRRAADLRDRRGRRADPGRAGRADARGRRLRQGHPGAAPRCSTPRCPTGSTPSGPPTCTAADASSCRSGTRRSPTSTAPTCSPASATSAATARRTTPTCGRW